MQLAQLIDDIKTLRIQGATQIALKSLEFLNTQPYSKWKFIANKLEKTRSTGVVLHNALQMAIREKNADKVIRKLRSCRQLLGEKGARTIKTNYNIMTHCHSGDALEVIKHAWRNGKKIKVYATETEPKHQGIITAKELSAMHIPTVLIEDPAAAYFMKDMDCVIVGCDAIREEGVVNKIGTYDLAIVAKRHRKPFYIIGTSFKIDKRKKIEIEERPLKEVYADLKSLKGIKIRNPAFDITPWDLITRVITEQGIMTPANVKRLLR